MRIPPPEVTAHLKREVADQIDIVLNHVNSEGPIDPLFVREHAMIIVQMAEVLLDPDQRLFSTSSPESDETTKRATS